MRIRRCSVGASITNSSVTLDELELAPDPVRGVLSGLPTHSVEIVRTSAESDGLRDAYLEAAVLGPASINDAPHIAVATISRVDLVVSWNFNVSTILRK